MAKRHFFKHIQTKNTYTMCWCKGLERTQVLFWYFRTFCYCSLIWQSSSLPQTTSLSNERDLGIPTTLAKYGLAGFPHFWEHYSDLSGIKVSSRLSKRYFVSTHNFKKCKVHGIRTPTTCREKQDGTETEPMSYQRFWLIT